MSKFTDKIDDIKRDAKTKAKEAKDWLLEPKNFATVVIGAMAIRKATRPIVKAIKDVREDDRKLTVYDPQLGVSVRLKRPLKPYEAQEYARRVENGQFRTDALRSMNLLK